MGTPALVLLIITALLIIAALVSIKKSDEAGMPVAGAFAFGALFTLVLTCIAGWLTFAPEYRLYKANIEKRIIVTQAIAEADADKEYARGEVERAKGTASANKIVAGSITEQYLRYLFVNNLKLTKNQIVYIPTEAGLPILEAGKR